ncbi:hypothetical protein Tco_1264964 [Tanacetum coccineum]
MEGSRRSGLGKGNGQVFEENTIDYVIDVYEEESEEDITDGCIKSNNVVKGNLAHGIVDWKSKGKKQNTRLGCLRKKWINPTIRMLRALGNDYCRFG